MAVEITCFGRQEGPFALSWLKKLLYFFITVLQERNLFSAWLQATYPSFLTRPLLFGLSPHHTIKSDDNQNCSNQTAEILKYGGTDK